MSVAKVPHSIVKTDILSFGTLHFQAAKSIGMSEAEAQKYISRRTDAKTKDRVRQYTQEALDHGVWL